MLGTAGAARSGETTSATTEGETFPASSVAVTAMLFGPSGRGSVVEQVQVPVSSAATRHSSLPSAAVTMTVDPASAVPERGPVADGSAVVVTDGAAGGAVSTRSATGALDAVAPSAFDAIARSVLS